MYSVYSVNHLTGLYLSASTSLREAAELMEKNRLLNLPVEEGGVVTKTVTRHDLLRTLLGMDIGIDF